mmetsp:Transcript_668/g.1220  ORF Transcript_668/g.1220 Transcript_668/m.1220 type:complete len:90 (+) Transcript_668:731-1000(+)
MQLHRPEMARSYFHQYPQHNRSSWNNGVDDNKLWCNIRTAACLPGGWGMGIQIISSMVLRCSDYESLGPVEGAGVPPVESDSKQGRIKF